MAERSEALNIWASISASIRALPRRGSLGTAALSILAVLSSLFTCCHHGTLWALLWCPGPSHCVPLRNQESEQRPLRARDLWKWGTRGLRPVQRQERQSNRRQRMLVLKWTSEQWTVNGKCQPFTGTSTTLGGEEKGGAGKWNWLDYVHVWICDKEAHYSI